MCSVLHRGHGEYEYRVEHCLFRVGLGYDGPLGGSVASEWCTTLSGMVRVILLFSVVEICIDYGGVYVFHVCFDLCDVYGVGICVDLCSVVCVVECYFLCCYVV